MRGYGGKCHFQQYFSYIVAVSFIDFHGKKKIIPEKIFGSVLETRENYGVSVLSKTGKVEQTLIINTLKKIRSKNTWEDFFRGVVIHVPLLYICKI